MTSEALAAAIDARQIELLMQWLESRGLTTSKICRWCQERKPLTDFVAHKTALDGTAGTCRQCRNKLVQERRLRDKSAPAMRRQ